MPGVWTGYIACMSGPIGMGVECAAEGMSAAYHVRLRPIAAVPIRVQDSAMILILASLLVAGPAHQLGDFPFAEGPSAGVSAIKAAIGKCHAPAKIVQSDDRVTVTLAITRSDRAFYCLSAWIAQHPDVGFAKFGFIGGERH